MELTPAEQNTSWEADSRSASKEIPRLFVGQRCPLLWLQDAATDPYLELHDSNVHPQT
jgi:hypothetical protein